MNSRPASRPLCSYLRTCTSSEKEPVKASDPCRRSAQAWPELEQFRNGTMETFAGFAAFITLHQPLEIFRRVQCDALAKVLPTLGSSGKGIRDDLDEAFSRNTGGRDFS